MHSSVFLLTAAFTSVMATPSPQASAAAGLPLGAPCDPSIPNVCANGASCYATNSMLIPSCGNFQASCTSDAQCAFNTCNNGFCNGPKPSTTTSQPPIPKPTGTNLPLGAQCDPAVPNQCANGVNCYATNVMLIPVCGNFQASCTSDAQCAFNTCNNGFCNGLKPSGTPTPTPSKPSTPKPTGTNLPLGADCDPAVKNQCAGGADCYATNSMLIPRCGNFQASCTSDAQCAFNKCNNGFCNGPLLSSSSSTPPTSTSSSSYTSMNTSTLSSTTFATTPSTTPTTVPTSVRYVNSTQTLDVPTGYTTSIIIVNGQTSSVLVNGAGATTSFGPSPTGSLQSSGAGQLASGFAGIVAVAVGFAFLL